MPLVRPEAGPSPGCPCCARPGRLHCACLSQAPPATQRGGRGRHCGPMRHFVQRRRRWRRIRGSVAAARPPTRLRAGWQARSRAGSLARMCLASRPSPPPPPPPNRSRRGPPCRPRRGRGGRGRRAVGGPPDPAGSGRLSSARFQSLQGWEAKGLRWLKPVQTASAASAAPLPSPRRSPRQSAGRPSPSLLASPLLSRASPLPPRPGLSPPNAWPLPHNPPLSP